MKRVLFIFSQLRYVEYSFDEQFLDISFRDGMLSRYLGIPSTIFFSLQNAYSPDNYFEENIRHVFLCASPSPGH